MKESTFGAVMSLVITLVAAMTYKNSPFVSGALIMLSILTALGVLATTGRKGKEISFG